MAANPSPAVDRDGPGDVGSLFDFGDDDAGNAVAAVPKVEFHIEAVSVSETKADAQTKVRFNNGNLYDYYPDPADPARLVKRPGGSQRPSDYETVHATHDTRQWVDAFRPHYRVLNLPKRNLLWMKEASRIAKLKEGVSSLHTGDLRDAVAETDVGDVFAHCDRSRATSGYFVRTETVSLKQGIHGVGPYYDLKMILESSVTATAGHQAVDEATKALKYYLFPWRDDLQDGREFRVFVCEGRVTAVSQQKLYSVNSVLKHVDNPADRETVIRNWLGLLLPFIEKTIIPNIVPRSFVLDIVLLGPPPVDAARPGIIVDLHEPQRLSPLFIETNSFGYCYGSGSALFNWVDHFGILHGVSEAHRNVVCFRYTSE